MNFLFFNELSIVKISKAFTGYARSYGIEITDSKDPSVQLTISKPSIEDLLKDLLDGIGGFKYQITLKILLRKYKKIQAENLLLFILILLLRQ